MEEAAYAGSLLMLCRGGSSGGVAVLLERASPVFVPQNYRMKKVSVVSTCVDVTFMVVVGHLLARGA